MPATYLSTPKPRPVALKGIKASQDAAKKINRQDTAYDSSPSTWLPTDPASRSLRRQSRRMCLRLPIPSLGPKKKVRHEIREKVGRLIDYHVDSAFTVGFGQEWSSIIRNLQCVVVVNCFPGRAPSSDVPASTAPQADFKGDGLRSFPTCLDFVLYRCEAGKKTESKELMMEQPISNLCRWEKREPVSSGKQGQADRPGHVLPWMGAIVEPQIFVISWRTFRVRSKTKMARFHCYASLCFIAGGG